MLRDRSLGYVEPDTIDRIVIEADGRTVSIARRGDGWIAAEDGRVIDATRIERLIDTFNETRVTSFATAAVEEETGLDQPRLRLRFYAWLSENTAEEPAGGQVLAGADFGSATADGAIFARVEGSNEKVTVPAELVALLAELAGVPPAPAPAVNPAD
jgi:hypothetical protein